MNSSVGIRSHTLLEGGESEPLSLEDKDVYEAVAGQQADVVMQYFCELLRQHCGPGEECAIKTSWRVTNTAVVYFRRFYLHNSLYVHDPRVFLVACLLLAGKTEEEFVAPALLIRHIHPSLDENNKQLQIAEEVLLQGLGYELQVYHPHSCMHALLTDIKIHLGATASGVIKQWSTDAELLINKMLNTGVCLSAIPIVMALGALLRTEPHTHPIWSSGSSDLRDEFSSLSSHMKKILSDDSWGKIMTDISSLNQCMDEDSIPPACVKSSLKQLASQAAWGTKDKKGKKRKRNKEDSPKK